MHLINIGFFCLLNVICTFVIPQEARIGNQGVLRQQFLGYVTFHGGTARSVFESLTKAMFALLAERVWYSKSQSSQLNIHFRLSGFQSSLPFTLQESVTQNFSDMSRSTFKVGVAQLQSVTEIAPKSPFLCVQPCPQRRIKSPPSF